MVPELHHIRKYASIFMAIHPTYLVLAEVNSSVNFFVYLARSSRFRQELRRLLLRCKVQCVRVESAMRLNDTMTTRAK